MATVAQGTRRPQTRFEDCHARNLDEAQRLRSHTALVVGVGAVGSLTAELLARHGLSLVLVDRDHLDIENCIRHALSLRYVGKPKSFALARKLREEFPREQRIHAFHVDVSSLTLYQLGSLAFSAGLPSLIIGATGNDAINADLDRIARALRVPFVAPGVFEQENRDLVGEIWLSPWSDRVGAGWACFRCGQRATGGRQEELDAVVGNPVDVFLVALETVSLAKGLLLPDSEARRRYRAQLQHQRQLFAIRRSDHSEISARLASDLRCEQCSDAPT